MVDLPDLIGLKKARIYQLQKPGKDGSPSTFPKAFPIGDRARGYYLDEIEEWVRKRATEGSATREQVFETILERGPGRQTEEIHFRDGDNVGNTCQRVQLSEGPEFNPRKNLGSAEANDKIQSKDEPTEPAQVNHHVSSNLDDSAKKASIRNLRAFVGIESRWVNLGVSQALIPGRLDGGIVAQEGRHSDVNLHAELLQRVNRWRFEQTDRPSQSEAIARLVEKGLAKLSDAPLSFSYADRILVAMIADLSRQLHVRDGLVKAELVDEAIRSGQYWALGLSRPELIKDKQDQLSDVGFVCDVLQMWRFLEGAFAAASEQDKKKMAEAAHPFGQEICFPGFDTEKEAECIRILRLLIAEVPPFTYYEQREISSSRPMTNTYTRMLHAFLPMREALNCNGLSVEQVKIILRARPIPPSMVPALRGSQ